MISSSLAELWHAWEWGKCKVLLRKETQAENTHSSIPSTSRSGEATQARQNTEQNSFSGFSSWLPLSS